MPFNTGTSNDSSMKDRMTENPAPPSVFSMEFHTKFFPRLLWSRLRPKKKEEEGVRFTHHMDAMILLAFCCVLAAIGIPLAVRHGSVVGWILILLGIGGILAMLIFSIFSQLSTKPSYDNFLIGVFFFCVFLGLTTGLFIGRAEHALFWRSLSGRDGERSRRSISSVRIRSERCRLR